MILKKAITIYIIFTTIICLFICLSDVLRCHLKTLYARKFLSLMIGLMRSVKAPPVQKEPRAAILNLNAGEIEASMLM